MLEQFSDQESGFLMGSVLGQPSNWRTAKFAAKFTNAELSSFGVDGVGHASSTGPVASSQNDVHLDDRVTSTASSSGWNDPDVMPTASKNRAANALADPEQNGSYRFWERFPAFLSAEPPFKT